jgi:hypothetical protein
MTAFRYLSVIQRGFKTFAGDVAEGFFEITHNSLALVGVVAVLVAAALLLRPDLRQQGEERLTAWLTARQPQSVNTNYAPEPVAVERATERTSVASPRTLPYEQANVALWIARKYRVGLEPVTVLVAEAYDAGQANGIDPALVLAVMAVESRFNPFAQSAVGAQGLMQVMTHLHSEKYKPFGGQHTAFDPKTNLHVGVKVLREYIARAGSVEAGLKWYVGAANLPTDGGYVDKVLAEHARLTQVAKGRQTPIDGNASALNTSTPTHGSVSAPNAYMRVSSSAPSLNADAPITDKATALNTDTSIADDAPARNADTSVADSAPTQNTDTSVADNTPEQDTDTSVADNMPEQDTDTSVADNTPSADAPIADSVPAPSADAPVADGSPAVTTDAPITDSAPAPLNADMPTDGQANLVALSR